MYPCINNIIAIPPGETIREQMIFNQISYAEFKTAMHMTNTEVDALLTGQTELTTHIAVQLESIFSTPAGFWLRLEDRYRAKQEKQKENPADS